MKKSIIASLLFATAPWCLTAFTQPKVTVLLVVDQLSEHVLFRHRPFLTGGLHTLIENGTYFTHAYHPHSQPETATGHAMISTGAYAQEHGLVANEWVQSDGTKVNACDDTHQGRNNKVFSPTDKTGKSAHALCADTLASRCIQSKENPYNVITLSLKSRAAIPLAGPHGQAIWFDTKAGYFTSSTAFFTQLPPWITAFNKHLENTLHRQKTTQWVPCFHPESEHYQYVDPLSYKYAGNAFSLVDTPEAFVKPDGKTYYHPYEQSPQASKDLFLLGMLALKMHTKYHPQKPLVLFISLSNFDYAGHYYGPYSKECVDILYSIDKQLDWFMNKIEKEFGGDNCLWALTADHGVMPIPELLSAEGNPKAHRILATPLQKELNRILYTTYNVKNLIKTVLPPHFYVDTEAWDIIDEETQKKIIQTTISFFKAQPGIVDAWHKKELLDPAFATRYNSNDRALWYAHQYMDGRSGDFVVQIAPYVELSLYDKGTCHDSPYDYDVRVPVAFYGKGIQKGTFTKPVSMRHFAPTVAHLLNVEGPRNAPQSHWGSIVTQKQIAKNLK